MSHHPLDCAPHDSNVVPLPAITEEDSFIPPWRAASPGPRHEHVVRASSPFGRRYLRPIHSIHTKGFARSAQRRSSVLTLGSIERLQHFYAKRELQVNKVGTLGFRIEEPDDLDSLPTPTAPPPSWVDLDIETDLDVLLGLCFQDIQSMLTTWSMVTGPHLHHDTDSDSDGSFHVLPLLTSVTKMIHAVKNYTLNRHDLPDESNAKLRQASLQLLASMRALENQYRMELVDEEEEKSEEGYLYRSSDFNMLEKERVAIDHYLETVEKYAFNPPHHIGSPPAVFTPEIKALMKSSHAGGLRQGSVSLHATTPAATETYFSGVPSWLERGSFVGDAMGRYYCLLKDNKHSAFENDAPMEELPDPQQDEDAFLQSLGDGIVLCNVYNNIVKRSRRPFGYITKVHQDTRRTYRAIENLRFFSAACKFRFELVFAFDPSEVARKTDKGLATLKTALIVFCDCVIKELRENTDMGHRHVLPTRPPIEHTISEYMEKKLFIRQQEQGPSEKEKDSH
ncbi:hypothetical protein BDF14DRAFT_1760188 [Spinellus fusiger]|nr:hypothetical protein BDF14DRAFT_1760188 [Spinellus fusiger]